MLESAAPALQGDKVTVLAAITKTHASWYTILHAFDALKDDRDVVLAAGRRNGAALEYASEALKDDYDVVHAACTTSSWRALDEASERLREDPSLHAVAEDVAACREATQSSSDE